ncbi:MAG: alpha/beta fold hydrolase [Bacteroidota bacterium]
MNRLFKHIYPKAILFGICVFLYAGLENRAFTQNNSLTLSEIWETYEYYPVYAPKIKHVPQKNAFSFLYQNKIVHKNYTQNKHTLFLEIPDSIYAQSFIYPPHSTSRLLIGTQLSPIRRDSYSAIFLEYDTTTQRFSTLFDTIPVQNPQYSPTSLENICFFYNNNLYLKSSDTIFPITTNGTENQIINGHPDWVYEEEFELTSGYSWNQTGSTIAYLSFDERSVPHTSIPYYTHGQTEYTNFPYPKAGDSIPHVSLYIYSIDRKQNTKILIPTKYDYIPEFSWIDSSTLAITLLDRLQQNIKIIAYSITSQTAHTIYSYSHAAYCDIPTHFTPLNESEFIVTDDRDGFTNIHLYDYTKGHISQLTKNSGIITDVYGYNHKTKQILFAATNNVPTDRYIFSVNTAGTMTEICSERGTHDIYFNSDCSFGIHNFSTANTPPKVSVINSRGTIQYSWFDNSHLTNLFDSFSEKEFFSIPHPDEDSLLAWKIVPANPKKRTKYPVILSIYGGPTSQKVLNKFSYDMYWHQFLAQQGYMVIAVDCRGVIGRNSDFRKQTYLKLGTYETEDIAHTIKNLHSVPHADTSKIGIEGWSYGGYLSALTSATYPKLIDAAVCIAPVTDWSLYDAIYTERYMQTPKLNPNGYTNSSVLSCANQIITPILIIHGTGDDNVHTTHSYLLNRELINNKKDIRFVPMTNDEHSLFGKNSRIYMYTKIFDFYSEILNK